jgi:RHS repeat-associated protein
VTQLVNAKSDGTTLTSHDYAYDSLGSPTSMVDSGGDRTTWTYDALSRLTRERRSGTNAYDITYTYDPVGNRATKLTGGVTTTYTYDAADELTVANAGGTRTTFTYDANGNALTQNAAGTWTTMTWGYEDEMKTVQSGGATATMTYDGDFMRRKRQEGATTANYLWDGAQVLVETDGSNNTVARYTLAPFRFGDLLAQRRSAASRWYHFDALGSTRALSDSGASVTDTALYQAFGTQVASSGSTVNPHAWVGKLGYATEARLNGYLLRRRYYADGAGRFLSRDPMGLGPGRTYGYVGERPTRSADPGGLQSMPRWRPRLPSFDDVIFYTPGGWVTGCFTLAWELHFPAQYMAAWRFYDPPRNSTGDAYRHCLWMCMLSALAGLRCALLVGEGREATHNPRRATASRADVRRRAEASSGTACLSCRKPCL